MNKTCDICGDVGKYKCPTCFIFYCSVTCCRKHREAKCDVLIQKSTDSSTKGDEELVVKRRKIESPSTVAEEKLELLKTNEEVTKLLTNNHLRNLLVTVDSSENPEEIMQKAMQEPIFVEFADVCLKVMEPEAPKQNSED